MRAVIVAASTFAVATASLLAAPAARACGGCVQPPAPKQVTVVTGHRMAFSVSPQQTVLWDQIEYSGSPQDFAWILPVRQGAQIQLSHDEFFAALDTLSNPVITGPTPNCARGGGNSGFGCSASSASGASFNAGGGSGGGSSVQVLSQGVVGPYDQVTLKASNPNALYDWLKVNKYDVPSTIRPIIDAYVGAGFDFIALRLAPGEGVQAMQPVRVVTPGAGLTLPLRMVAAGVGANVGITLYVIGDGRYQAQNFPNATVDASRLVWLHAQSASNYEPLAEQIMQRSGGRTWLTEYAQVASLQDTPGNLAAGGQYSCGGAGAGVSYSGGLSLADLYYAQCLCLGSGAPSPQAPEASVDAQPDDASEDAPGEAGAGSSGLDGAPATPDGSEAPGGCDTFDDLAVLARGLDPNSTWVTRMRAILPSSALAEGDLVLQAATDQGAVSSQYTASVYDDPTYDPCPSAGGGCNATDDPPVLTGRALVVGALAFLGAALARRRRAIR